MDQLIESTCSLVPLFLDRFASPPCYLQHDSHLAQSSAVATDRRHHACSDMSSCDESLPLLRWRDRSIHNFAVSTAIMSTRTNHLLRHPQLLPLPPSLQLPPPPPPHRRLPQQLLRPRAQPCRLCLRWLEDC